MIAGVGPIRSRLFPNVGTRYSPWLLSVATSHSRLLAGVSPGHLRCGGQGRDAVPAAVGARAQDRPGTTIVAAAIGRPAVGARTQRGQASLLRWGPGKTFIHTFH